ncbi:MAG TPA: tetratricopeptide repeat protein [Terriglobales bacterium]|nr:tetratricopeptide repeat protein [Terriglobales bacterium]
MKSPHLVSLLLTLTLTLPGFAQGRPGSGGGKTPAPTVRSIPSPSEPKLNAPNLGRVFLSGKVVLDDGTPLTESATIQTICKGERRNEAYTDSHGNFSFEFGDRRPGSSAVGIGDAETSFSDSTPNRLNQRDWHDCELQAVLPGYSSQVLELASKVYMSETTDLGRIALHRLGEVQGFTVSATSAQAPSGARKAFEKGWDQQKKQKWDDAQRSFEKAVQIYPKYAVAWFELGRTKLQKSDEAGAREAFSQALGADSKFVSPYQGLAGLAMRRHDWQEVVKMTNQIVALNPVNFPNAWLQNSVGNYSLRNFEAAEQSARRGLKIDPSHQIPKLEYMLGMILMQKASYKEAEDHMQQFLHLATQPADAEEAQKQLAQIAKLSAAAPAAVSK